MHTRKITVTRNESIDQQPGELVNLIANLESALFSVDGVLHSVELVQRAGEPEELWFFVSAFQFDVDENINAWKRETQKVLGDQFQIAETSTALRNACFKLER